MVLASYIVLKQPITCIYFLTTDLSFHVFFFKFHSLFSYLYIMSLGLIHVRIQEGVGDRGS